MPPPQTWQFFPIQILHLPGYPMIAAVLKGKKGHLSFSKADRKTQRILLNDRKKSGI